jgi:hypothetical protein
MFPEWKKGFGGKAEAFAVRILFLLSTAALITHFEVEA